MYSGAVVKALDSASDSCRRATYTISDNVVVCDAAMRCRCVGVLRAMSIRSFVRVTGCSAFYVAVTLGYSCAVTGWRDDAVDPLCGAADYDTFNYENETMCCCVEPWASLFTRHCSSSLSCVSKLLGIDSGGYVFMNRLDSLITAWLYPSHSHEVVLN